MSKLSLRTTDLSPPSPDAERDSWREPAFQHKLEQFNPGMVWLDGNQCISAINDVAINILAPAVKASMGILPEALIGSNILQVHPPKSREKIEFLLRSNGEHGQHAHPPASPGHGFGMFSPPPVAMMINIPERLLMIKVSQMMGANGIVGTCMIFYDLTEATTSPAAPPKTLGGQAEPRMLSRIPVYRRDRIVLVDVKDVARFEGNGHYTNIITPTEKYICNFSMAVLEERLNPEQFLRVHRSHIVNLDFAVELMRLDDGMMVVMPPGMGDPVPVSKNNLVKLKQRFGLI
jgi:LytTR family transcriptional regulator, CO-responsive transcriptional regulator RcoM